MDCHVHWMDGNQNIYLFGVYKLIKIYLAYIYKGKFYSTLSKTSCLYGSTPRSIKASTTNVDKAPSQTLRLLDCSRTVGGSRQGIRNEEMVYPPR
uniref:Uncharacterized protein n=1 Tax=Oryza sativa subsp. japonica TaxID=39947 RepID=Q337X6_ORYSJ|nr:hypothetical protein LOC_Os10g29590 [Oryza sativa Japonica Group]